jgi:hypothetical protein
MPDDPVMTRGGGLTRPGEPGKQNNTAENLFDSPIDLLPAASFGPRFGANDSNAREEET